MDSHDLAVGFAPSRTTVSGFPALHKTGMPTHLLAGMIVVKLHLAAGGSSAVCYRSVWLFRSCILAGIAETRNGVQLEVPAAQETMDALAISSP